MTGWTAYALFVGLIFLIIGVALWLGEGGTAKPGKGGGNLFSSGMPGHEVGGGGGADLPPSDSGIP
jgi:hypothetical protein